MTELEIRGGCVVFHSYENGEKVESNDFFDNSLEPNQMNVVDEQTLDLSEVEDVHIRQESYDDTYYSFNDDEELPDDYKFDVRITHVILPNKEVWDMIDIIDSNIDNDTFETSSGSSFVDYYSVTKDGQESIDGNDEDDEW